MSSLFLVILRSVVASPNAVLASLNSNKSERKQP